MLGRHSSLFCSSVPDIHQARTASQISTLDQGQGGGNLEFITYRDVLRIWSYHPKHGGDRFIYIYIYIIYIDNIYLYMYIIYIYDLY